MKIIEWKLMAVDLGLTPEELKAVMAPGLMKPLHEAFIKEMLFRFPELRNKLQLGVGVPQVIESGIIT